MVNEAQELEVAETFTVLLPVGITLKHPTLNRPEAVKTVSHRCRVKIAPIAVSHAATAATVAIGLARVAKTAPNAIRHAIRPTGGRQLRPKLPK